MGRKTPSARIIWIALCSLLLCIAALPALGCGKSEPPGDGGTEEENGVEVEGDGSTATYDLVLYFRYGGDTQEWLAPEERTVSGVEDPYLAAMEELIRGPGPDSQLEPVLPHTVKVLGVEVADGVAVVDVSKEILTDANEVGVSAVGESLALAAIADTLTEFDGVSRVKLLIEGMQSGMVEGRFVEDFWGHMGLPEYLERNEDVIFR